MLLKEKHTRISIAITNSFTCKKVQKLLLLVSVFLFPLIQGFASSETYTIGNSTIIYSATNSNDVVIINGNLTAVEGKTIRLLPGTIIKSTEEITVNIASKACQKAVAAKVKREKESAMVASTVKKIDAILQPEKNDITKLLFDYKPLPSRSSELGQQSIKFAASLVNTTLSFKTPMSLLTKKNENSENNIHIKSNTLKFYTPTRSWGVGSETVKVMRC